MDVFAAAADAMRTGRRAALALVIAVRGSTPRRSGARMLVFEDGSTVGTIGGGTVEFRVVEMAIACIRSGQPERFDAHLTRDLGMCCGGEMSVFIEPIQPKSELVLFGAGHVAHALAPIADALGFGVVVVDDRDELNTEERFPLAERIVEPPDLWADALVPHPDRYLLIVTHDHALDQRLVQTLLPRSCAWLGMIGSRAKVAKFFVRLRGAGMDPALFSKLSAPVGLALGAQHPAEIAVSIAGELVRVRNGFEGASEPLSHAPLPARDKHLAGR